MECSAQIAALIATPTLIAANGAGGEAVPAVESEAHNGSKGLGVLDAGRAPELEGGATIERTGANRIVSNAAEPATTTPPAEADAVEVKPVAARPPGVALTPEFEAVTDPVDLETEMIAALVQPPKEAAAAREPAPDSRTAKENPGEPSTLNFQPASFRGTAAAKQEVRMNSVVEMDETAGQVEKNLPGDAISDFGFRISESPIRTSPSAIRSRDVEPDSLAFNVASPVFSALSQVKVENASPSMSDPAVDRVARVLFDGVAHVRQAGRESMTVSISPQPGTEWLLRVEMRDGAVSAHLQFERGDRQWIDGNWQELQRRMADQGVTLHRDGSEARAHTALFQQDFSQSQRGGEGGEQNAEILKRQKAEIGSQDVSATVVRQRFSGGPGFQEWA